MLLANPWPERPSEAERFKESPRGRAATERLPLPKTAAITLPNGIQHPLACASRGNANWLSFLPVCARVNLIDRP